MSLKEIRILVIFAIAVIFVFIGLIGWSAPFDSQQDDLTKELPISNISGIVVDNEGYIYCGVGYKARVQVYDKNGNFVRTIGFDAAGGTFHMGLDVNGNLNIATVRNDMLYIFSRDGKALDSKKIDDIYNAYTEESQYSFMTADKVTYRIKHPMLFPQVIKEYADGNSKTVISIGFFSWLVMPFPSLIFGLVGIFTLYEFYNRIFYPKKKSVIRMVLRFLLFWYLVLKRALFRKLGIKYKFKRHSEIF